MKEGVQNEVTRQRSVDNTHASLRAHIPRKICQAENKTAIVNKQLN